MRAKADSPTANGTYPSGMKATVAAGNSRHRGGGEGDALMVMGGWFLPWQKPEQ